MHFLLFFVLSIWTDLHLLFFFFNDTATTEIYTLSLHDALPIFTHLINGLCGCGRRGARGTSESNFHCSSARSEEHTSELQSPDHLVCRLLLEKKKKTRAHYCVSLMLWLKCLPTHTVASLYLHSN